MPFEVRYTLSTLVDIDTDLHEDNSDTANGLPTTEGVVTKFFDVEDYEWVEFFLNIKGATAPTAGKVVEVYALFADDGTIGTQHVDAGDTISYNASNPQNLTAANATLVRNQAGAPVHLIPFENTANLERKTSFKVNVAGRKTMALFFYNNLDQSLSSTEADHYLRMTGHTPEVVAT